MLVLKAAVRESLRKRSLKMNDINKEISLKTGIPIKILNDMDKAYIEYLALKKDLEREFKLMQGWWVE